jgi:hypothetical protein
MTISCRIEFEDGTTPKRLPYRFDCLPRIGETIALEWDDKLSRYPTYAIVGICHVPDDAQEIPAFTVLRVKPTGW